MFELFQMWALVEMLGIIFLPLTVTIFRALPDRGWALSKTLALLVTSFCVWLPLMLFHGLFFNWIFILVVVILLFVLNVIGFLQVRQTLWQLMREHRWYLTATEALFFLMVLLLGWLRSFGPAIVSYERYMDEGFLASIMRSQHFPPSDMWFAGYSINYYYYAHYIVAMLATLLGQIPSVAFNTGISMLYGLSAVSLFGVTCNLIACSRRYRAQQAAQISEASEASEISEASEASEISEASESSEPAEMVVSRTKSTLLGAIPFGVLTVIMALMLGNLASAVTWWQQVYLQHGTFDWMWPDTRVIPHTINEFPAFSFLLSDFHAHVLALSFTILALGFALNLLLAPEGEGIFIFGRGWRLWLTLGCAALSMGGLYVMNGWDLPTYFGLIIVCIGVQQWLIQEKRQYVKWLLNVLSAVLPLAVLTVICDAPFLLTFVSPSEGIGIVPVTGRSSLNQELLIYGVFAFIFLTLLCSSLLRRELASWHDQRAAPADEQDVQGEHAAGGYLSWPFIVILTGSGLVLIGLACQFISPQNATLFIASGLLLIALVVVIQQLHDRAYAFTLFLGALALALIAACEVVFLRDVFSASPDFRMNTVFKFYFQAWILFSIACGAGLYYILANFRVSSVLLQSRLALRRIFYAGRVVWSSCLVLLLLAACIYPLAAPYYRSASYSPITQQLGMYRTNSLDGMTYLQDDQVLHGDYDAIRWLNAHVSGTPVIVEAVHPTNGEYTTYGRISAFTGLPTIMGWLGHEEQWRVEWYANNTARITDFYRRQADVQQIYTDPNAQDVLNLLANYHAQYLYVGDMERSTYPGANLERFASFMRIVYKSGSVTIYGLSNPTHS